jgi:hypothetical protein
MAAPDWSSNAVDSRSLKSWAAISKVFYVAFAGSGTKEDNKVVDKGLTGWNRRTGSCRTINYKVLIHLLITEPEKQV